MLYTLPQWLRHALAKHGNRSERQRELWQLLERRQLLTAAMPGDVRQDVLTIPMDGTIVTSTFVPQAGVTYHLRASGTTGYIDTPNGRRADAEYYDYQTGTAKDVSSPNLGSVDVGLRLVDASGTALPDGRWGSYQSSHAYVKDFVGTGQPLKVRYIDVPGYYTDNSGTLTFQIYEPVKVSQLTLTNNANASNAATASSTTAADLDVRQDPSGRATVQLSAIVAPTHVDSAALSLWTIDTHGNTASRLAGKFSDSLTNRTVAFTKVVSEDFTVKAGGDINENGVLDVGEVQRTINVHVRPNPTISGAAGALSGAAYSLSLHPYGMDADSVSWSIDWGDGSQATVGDVPSVDHVYQGAAANYSITATASDTARTIAANSAPVSISSPTQSPYGGTAWSVPGLIENENFDVGGESVAYHDVNRGNIGGFYRRSEDVDVDIARDDNGSFIIGWAKAGEWLEYTVNVQASGTYDASQYLSSPGDGGGFHWEVDGAAVTSALTVPNTGSYYNYQPVTESIALSAGIHVLRLSLDTNGTGVGWSSVANFNYFTLINTSVSLSAPTVLSATAAFPTRVDLSWSDSNENETGFKLERSTDGVTWSQVAVLRANTTSYADTALTAGSSYSYRLRATNGAADSSYSNITTAVATPLTAALPLKVNFQVDGTPPVPGYKVDSGAPYGNRGDGLFYGWSVDEQIQDRERSVSPDRRQDTLIHFREGANWHLDVPDGMYDVTVSVGDGAYASTYTINVNRVNYWNAQPLAANNFQLKTLTIEAKDGGGITIDQGDAANRATRINYVEIASPGGSALPVVTISANDASASEPGTDGGQFTITRAGGNVSQSLEVFLGVDTVLSSASGGDYVTLPTSVVFGANEVTKVINLTPIDDGTAESDEDVVLAVQPNSAYQRGNPFAATVTIHDDETANTPQVSIVASDRYGSERGPDAGRFTITRTGGPTNVDLVVPYIVSGTASTGDYEALKSVTIRAGSTSAVLDVSPKNDLEDENMDSVKVTLQAPAGYSLGSASTATVFILDDESQPLADLDLFEDAAGDGIHDDTIAAELNEAEQPLNLPLTSDNQPEKLALTLQGVPAGGSITFQYATADIHLYYDAAGTQPIPANTPVPISNLGFPGTGTGIGSIFVDVTTEGAAPSGISINAGAPIGTIAQLLGGIIGFGKQPPPDDVKWRNNDKSDDNNDGGLDDGDGNQPLTDRDGWWDKAVNSKSTSKNKDGGFLIIGFSGHTQSEGFHDAIDVNTRKGKIWNVKTDTGTYILGQKLRDKGYPVTLFPEDPGNDKAMETLDAQANPICGDGVLGVPNKWRNDARTDVDGKETGALAFLIDAIKGNAAENRQGKTKIGLYGYSHGGGSLEILMQGLWDKAQNDQGLKNLIYSTPGQPAPPVTFFWSADIDAVNIKFDNGNHTDASGFPTGEDNFPLVRTSDFQGAQVLGTNWHFNIYQQGDLPLDGNGDNIPLSGNDQTDKDDNGNFWTDYGRARDHLRQVYTDGKDSAWVKKYGGEGLDHTNRKGHGIAEDADVQALVLQSFDDALAALMG